jgi:hypothetical protein
MGVVHVPQLIHVNTNARNGMSPSANLHRKLVDAHNHLARYGAHRTKYARGWELGVDDSASGTRTIARFRFRTGYHASQLVVQVLALPTTDRGGWSGAGPTCEIDLTTGATTSTLTYATGIETGTPDDGPDDHNLMEGYASATANAVYTGAIRLNQYARIASVMVYELGESTPANTSSPAAGSPIYDADREALLVGLSNMHTRNGGICSHWSLMDGAARTRTSATPINIVDGTSTGTPTAGTNPGFYLDTEFHNRRRDDTVPFELAAYASIAGGATGTVRLIDEAGNVYTHSVTSASLGWAATTINLPATETYYAIQFFSDGGVQTLTVHAVSLVETG